jgi:UDP-N-acetylmuramoyl-L-alanyl-D-glutamate--2,6-diaminopimelate ligase
VRVGGETTTRITGLAYDVRDVAPGDLFAALEGAEFRGHGVAEEAVRRGARAVLVQRELDVAVPMLVTEDPAASLARLASAFYGHPSTDLRVIGVTGTDGKTTTAHLVEEILRSAGVDAGAITTLGVGVGGRTITVEGRLTTPESPEVQRYLREIAETGAKWAVVEATSHGLALKRLDEVRFEIAAVTNVTHEHLDFHGTRAAYLEAKGLLFRRVAEARATAVVNADDPGALRMADYADGARLVTYGVAECADVRALDADLEGPRARFRLMTPDAETASVELAVPGRFNIENALCAAACAFAAGIAPATIAAGLSAAAPVPGRMSVIDAGQPFAVVVDFAHTPVALEQVLRLLRRLHPAGRLIAVLGSAGERDRLKRPLLGEISAREADYSVFTSEDPRYEDADAVIAEVALGALMIGGRENETFACVTDRRDAIRHALSRAAPQDCVLLAGKGHERSIVWGAEERPWNEIAVARELLGELGYVEGIA